MLAPPKPPSRDELELLIKEARARRRRRYLLTAAGVAITTALGLAIYALAGSVGSHGADDRSARGGVRPCRAAQLATSAEAGAGDGGPLTDGASIQLVDTSSRACALPIGIPKVTFAFRGNTIRVGERTRQPPYTGLGPRAGQVLAPRRKVMYDLEWFYRCPRPGAGPTRGEAAEVILRFRNGLRLAMPEGTPENIPILPNCGEELGPAPSIIVTPPLQVPA